MSKKAEREFMYNVVQAFFGNSDLEMLQVETKFGRLAMSRKCAGNETVSAVGFHYEEGDPDEEDEEDEDYEDYCKDRREVLGR